MWLLSEYQLIRTWWNCVWVGERDSAQVRRWGRASVSIRKLLRALGVASQLSGSTTTGFGVRYLALLSTLDYRTVAKLLQRLRDEEDPWIEQVSVHHHEEPDRYLIRIPDRYREVGRWRRWRAGRFDAIHPAFRALPAPAALVYEALSDIESSTRDLCRLAAVSATATADALRELAAHGLAERDRHGWRRGPIGLDEAAQAVGASQQHEEVTVLYAEHRRIWHELLASATAAPRPRDSGEGTADDSSRADRYAERPPPPAPPAWLDEDPGPSDDLPAEIEPPDPQYEALVLLEHVLGAVPIIKWNTPPPWRRTPRRRPRTDAKQQGP